MEKVPVVPPLSRKDIEGLALAVLQETNQYTALDGKVPVDIEAIYEIYIPDRHRIVTGYTDLTPFGQGVLGYTNAATKESYVERTLIDALDSPTIRRGRATTGHEAAHCILHVRYLHLFQSLNNSSGDKLYRTDRKDLKPFLDPEWQGWEFARACLMPRRLLAEYLRRGYSNHDMANCFEVNPAFIDVRLRTLGFKN